MASSGGRCLALIFSNDGGRMAIARIALAILVALLLGACSGRPHGSLVATHQRPPGASVVDLLVVTTRSPDRVEPGVMFSGERGRGVAFADIAVSIPPQSRDRRSAMA